MFYIYLVAYKYQLMSPKNNLYESSYCNSLDISPNVSVQFLDVDILEKSFPSP